MDNLISTWNFRRGTSPVGPMAPQGNLGLDASIIKSFPSFIYSTVKDLRKEKYSLECAICLSEFLDDDLLRLLTVCCHVYHQECIDLWLGSHKTCPVCRQKLDPPENPPEKPAFFHSSTHNSDVPMQQIDENEPISDAFSVDIKEDNERRMEEQNEGKLEKFSRSHSTGHSIVRNRGEEDRFTLILPDHVKVKFARGHNWTGSCTIFGDFSSKTAAGSGGFGELSSFSESRDVNKV